MFGNGVIGSICVKLLLLMVLSSAAASTQTTILPTARTALAMSVYRAIPTTFSKIHKKYLTPTNATVAWALVSAVLYVIMNYLSGARSSATRSPPAGCSSPSTTASPGSPVSGGTARR